MNKVSKVTTDDDPRIKDTDFRPKLASVLEQTLDSFGITARVAEVNNRPKDIEFCLEIALGTSIESILKLRKDLALAMASYTGDIEIEAPIPGRSLIAIRLPYEKQWFQENVDYMKNVKLLPPNPKPQESKPLTVRQTIATGFYLIATGFGKIGQLIDTKE